MNPALANKAPIQKFLPMAEAGAAQASPPPPRLPLNEMNFGANRVLIYTTCYNVIDGVTLTIRKLEQEILASGGHVCILTTKSGLPKNTNLDGTHPNRRVLFLDDSIPIPFYDDPNNPEMQLHVGFSLSRSVTRLMDAFGPTIVHVTVPDLTGLCIVQYARSREVPLMGTYHSNYVDYMDHYRGMGWLKPILEGWTRHQYNFYQALYVPTPYVRRNLVGRYKMDRVTELGIWGRGVDPERFGPQHRSMSFRRKLGIADSDAVVCFAGRLVPEKRADIFASVIRRLAARGARYHALVVGLGPCQEELASLPNATCVGWLSGHDLAVAYASSDVFLFPSSVETFGNVTLEAAASGLPLVVEEGCSGHLVRDGVNGYACPAGDEDAFFRATLSLVDDRQLREKYSARSRRFGLTLGERNVVQEMIVEYGRVSEEFHRVYGGRHQNRDDAFRHQDSFCGGTNPRPLGLVFIERIFVLAFRLFWWVLSAYRFLQDVVIITISLAVQDRASLNRTAASRGASEKAKVLETIGKQSQSELLEDNPSEIESGLGESGHSGGPRKEESPDEEEEEKDLSCCTRSVTSFGDGPYARTVVTAFVRFLIFQWRTSSRIREAASSLGARCRSRRGGWPGRRAQPEGRKRKNSHMPKSPPLPLRLRGRVLTAGSDDTDISSESLYTLSREEELEHRTARRSLVPAPSFTV